MAAEAPSPKPKSGWSIWAKLGCASLVVLPPCVAGGFAYMNYAINMNTRISVSERRAAEKVSRLIRANHRLPKSWVDLFHNTPGVDLCSSPDPAEADARLVQLHQFVDIDFTATLEGAARSEPKTFRYVHAKLRRKPDDPESSPVPYAHEIIKAAVEALQPSAAAVESEKPKPAGSDLKTPR